MQQFDITLKNEKASQYERLSGFFILILTLIFAYLAFLNGDNAHPGRKIALIIMLAGALLLKVYFQKTKYRFGVSIFFYFLMMGFISIEYYLIAGIVFVFDMLYLISIREKVVILSKDSIHYPSFPPRSISWSTLNNVLLKDGLLTIDSKNNKVIQQLIDDKNSKINEMQFNEFCREQLRKSGPWKDGQQKLDALSDGLNEVSKLLS